LAEHRLAHRCDDRAWTIPFFKSGRLAVARMFATEVLKNLSRISLGLAQLHTRFQASHDGEEIRRSSLCVEGEWRPKIGLVTWKLELSGHHTDDLCRRIIQTQRAADNAWITAEASLPERMTDHADLVLALHVFAFGKRATEQRIDAEDLEEVRGHSSDRQSFRLARAGEVRGGRVVNRDRFKRAILFAVRSKVGLRNTPRRQAKLRTRLQHPHEPVGFTKRKWPQQDAVYETEYRRIRANPERERDDR